MPLHHYGVLKGQALDARREDGEDTPHYQVRLVAGTTHYRIAVNVQSKAHPSELLFLVDDNFQHPVLARLQELSLGFTPLPRQPGGLALDFIRANLFDRLKMRPLPASTPGPDNDLSDRLEHYVQRAIRDPGALVYAFGERWGPENQRPDKIFRFTPGNGIHDIHMNQGNAPAFVRDDGVWQDGALLLHFPTPPQWVALFLAFQSQAGHTDDVTGHALETPVLVPSGAVLRIVAALVNPVGPAPERETVTLLNASPQPIDLQGWKIADKLDNQHPLSGTAAPGATVVIPLPPDVQLGNQGGIITLLDSRGLKVDGVSYTAQQAQREGWTLVF